MKRKLSALALALLVSAVLFGLACQEKLPSGACPRSGNCG